MSGAIIRTPARYREPTFDSGGWDGPGITLRFTSTKPPASVFRYYADRATQFSWIATGKTNVLGYSDEWTKTYPGSIRGYLMLIDLGIIRTPTRGTPSKYVLYASA